MRASNPVDHAHIECVDHTLGLYNAFIDIDIDGLCHSIADSDGLVVANANHDSNVVTVVLVGDVVFSDALIDRNVL